MRIETDRYNVSFEEIREGGPSGYESVYLTSEGDPASQELYDILGKYKGKLLSIDSNVIRQRNDQALTKALREGKPVGIASGFKPSGAYHFGHKLTSETVSFFQKNGAQVFIPVADIECSMDQKLSRDQYQFWAADNLIDWGANGVNLNAAHVYLQSEEFRVSTLSYIVARSLNFKLAADIYSAEKLISDFPFLFAGITQVGDILLPQHKEFGNHHSFMISGQDQDGHMKMTVTLTQATLESGIDLLGVHTVPSGFYIPHIRGISGDKASSSKAESTIYLGPGPNMEDLTERTRSSLKKVDEADRNYLDRCSLDMVRYLDFFNKRSQVSFEELCSEPTYKYLVGVLEAARTRDEQKKAQNDIDIFLINRCKDQGQNNSEIIIDSLPEALAEHQKRRETIISYAKARVKETIAFSGEEDAKVIKPIPPDFWQVPDVAVVSENKRNATQWFHIIDKVVDKICP